MKLLCSFILLLPVHICLSQKFTVKFDTAKFDYPTGPFTFELVSLFNESPLGNYLSADNLVAFPVNKKGKYFELNVSLKRPSLIQLVNTDVLTIPGREVTALVTGQGDDIRFPDSSGINYFFADLRRSIKGLRINMFGSTNETEFLYWYDSLKSLVSRKLQYISTPENRQAYKIDFSVISVIRQYCMAEMGNLLFTSPGAKNNYSDALYKKYKADIKIDNPAVLMDFQAGRLFLQRYFFYYSLPQHQYNLAQTLNSDSFLLDTRIKKYLGYRYFARLYADEAILARIPDFEGAFKTFRAGYSFLPDQQAALDNLAFRIKENKSTILAAIIKEELISPGGNEISNNQKMEIFNGNTILYIWASWCQPCRAYLNSIKSDRFEYLRNEYKMVFLSIDENTAQWKKVSNPVFTGLNNFKFKNPAQSRLLKNYELDKAVPRVLILQGGKLAEPNVDKAALLQK